MLSRFSLSKRNSLGKEASNAQNANEQTPESDKTNRRNSYGRVQSASKASPSPNRQSTKIQKESGTPSTPSKQPHSNIQSPISPPVPVTPSAQSVHSSTNSSEKSKQGQSSAAEQNLIKVCVRVRPFLSDELNENPVWQWKDNQISAIPPNQRTGSGTDYVMANPNATFTFDHLFTPEHSNIDIFEQVVRDIVTAGMNGYHGSVFTYGQTSSGKTFTMYGGSAANPQVGVITQAIQFCFDAINAFPEREFLLRVSYLEVYNEQVMDLLNSESSTPIKILYDPKQGTVLSGVKEHVVFNPQQVYQLIKTGEQHRHVGVTDMNAKSSRAHTLFKIIVESKERGHSAAGKPSPVRVSTLNLVDLAGSENAKMTNSVGERAREARHINQSLLTLSTIIHRLSEDQQRRSASSSSSTSSPAPQHLPYRDSKLTRLLESALDGNARIAIICNISPTARCLEESANTLKFGARAKLIRLFARVNENLDDKTLLRAYREEIEQLKSRLKELEDRQTVAPPMPVPAANESPLVGGDGLDGQDNGSIEVEVRDSASSGLQDTIHQIEGRLLQAQAPAVPGEDEQSKMLQMIEAMERLILKADTNKNKLLSRRSSFNVSSSETVEAGDGRSLRLRSSRSGADLLGDGTKVRKSASFATGIPIVVPAPSLGSRSSIPRRSSLSRSASQESSGPVSVEKFAAADLEVSLSPTPEASPKPGKSPKTAGLLSPKSPLKRKEAGFFFRPGADEQQRPPRPVSSKEVAVDESSEASPLPAPLSSPSVASRAQRGEAEGFPPLTRHESIPLTALQENFSRLETSAERLGIHPAHAHAHSHPGESQANRGLSEREKSVIYSAASHSQSRSLSRDGLDGRQASISPLTVGTEQTAGLLLTPLGQLHQQAVPTLIPEAAASGSRDPQDKAAETAEQLTPVKNRIRRVKYQDEPAVALVAASASLSDQESVQLALERMRQLAVSNDTLDSQLSSHFGSLAGGEVQIEDDSVLLGVSKMLTLLKDYIAKPRTARPSGSADGLPDGRKVLNSGAIEGIALAASEASLPPAGRSVAHGPGHGQHSAAKAGTVSREELEKLREDLSLKEADNHFLQEELEQKDRMLSMLTDGLKEVQESQLQWLTANQDLSQELEKALLINQILKNEIGRLTGLLNEALHGPARPQNPSAAAPGPLPPAISLLSEEVALLLQSPALSGKAVSSNQHMYLAGRARSSSHGPLPAGGSRLAHPAPPLPTPVPAGEAVQPPRTQENAARLLPPLPLQNNQLDWRAASTDFTNLHTPEEVEEAAAVALSISAADKVVDGSTVRGEEVLVQVERIYSSCDSTDSFGPITEKW